MSSGATFSTPAFYAPPGMTATNKEHSVN